MNPRQLAELRSQLYRLRTWRYAPTRHWVFARSFHDGILIFRLFRDKSEIAGSACVDPPAPGAGAPHPRAWPPWATTDPLRTPHHDAPELKRALTLLSPAPGFATSTLVPARRSSVPVDTGPRHPDTWRPDLHERRVGDAVVRQARRMGRSGPPTWASDAAAPGGLRQISDTLDPPAVPPPLPPPPRRPWTRLPRRCLRWMPSRRSRAPVDGGGRRPVGHGSGVLEAGDAAAAGPPRLGGGAQPVGSRRGVSAGVAPGPQEADGCAQRQRAGGLPLREGHHPALHGGPVALGPLEQARPARRQVGDELGPARSRASRSMRLRSASHTHSRTPVAQAEVVGLAPRELVDHVLDGEAVAWAVACPPGQQGTVGMHASQMVPTWAPPSCSSP